MDNTHSAIRKRVVIDTKLFYDDFRGTFDAFIWGKLEARLMSLIKFSENLGVYGDDISNELDDLLNTTIELREKFIDGNEVSVQERNDLDRKVAAVRDVFIKRFGDA